MLKFLEKKSNLIIITIFLTIVSFLIRIQGINFISGDYPAFQLWVDFIKANGGFRALATYFSAYNIPYLTLLAAVSYLPFDALYLIKGIPIAFDYILAVSVGFLTFEIVKENKHAKLYSYLAYVCVIFLPTVVLNSAFWGQCDSIYTAFVIISLFFLVKENYFKSFIFLGVACAFKLQFIFIVPLYIAVYLGKRKFPMYYFFIIILVNFILCLPAAFAGRDLTSSMLIYYDQAESDEYISMNFPGIYNLLLNVPEKASNLVSSYSTALFYGMILFTMGIFAVSFLYVLKNKINFNKNLIIEYGIWSVSVCTFFLPHMHERYMYIAEILSIIYAINGKKYKALIPFLLNYCSIITYIVFLYKINLVPIQFITLINMGVLLAMTNLLIISFRKEKIKLICDYNANIEGKIAKNE